jgi:hypothetical protein
VEPLNDTLVDLDSWYECTNAFDAKDYPTAFYKLLKYINPSFIHKISNPNEFKLVQKHGSTEISVEVSNQFITVSAPLVYLTPQTNRVALLRKVVEVNFFPMTMAQIYLKDDLLSFYYQTELALGQPYKMYDVMREIAYYADVYDDEFVEQYQAAHFYEDHKTPLQNDKLEKAKEQIAFYFKEYQEYMLYYEEKRWESSKWDIIMLTLFRIGLMPYVHGNLKYEIKRQTEQMLDAGIDYYVRIDRGKSFMKALMEKSQNDVYKDLYLAEEFMSMKWRTSPKIIQDYIGGIQEDVKKYQGKDDFYNLAFAFEYAFLKLLYDYTLNDEYIEMIFDSLEKASSKSYEEATKILMETYNHLLNNTFPEKSNLNKDNFFTKLFKS